MLSISLNVITKPLKGIIVKIICFYINQIGYKFQVFLY